jgi:hypothetical protein
MLTFENFFIEFHRQFYFWERFEKRVFPTDSLSRTDTFGTHCTLERIQIGMLGLDPIKKLLILITGHKAKAHSKRKQKKT